LGATVSGGYSSSANNSYATVGGGWDNIASGWGATVPGGQHNESTGKYSFAAGQQAKANHDGTFVWADARNYEFASTRANEFRVRATNGAYIWSGNAAYGLDVNNTGGGDAIRARVDTSGSLWAGLAAINSGSSPALFANSAGTYSAYFMDNI
jgi:hypothetical protein